MGNYCRLSGFHVVRSASILLMAVLFDVRPAGAQAPSVPWWQQISIQRELNLTTQQVQAIDRLYRQSLPERRRLRRRAAMLRAKLEDLFARSPFDDATAARLVDSLATADMRANVARATLLVRIRQRLRPDQLARFEQVRTSALVHLP